MSDRPDRHGPSTVLRAGRLLRVLGVGFGLAVTIGNTIGAGIFRAPGEVARHLPDGMLFLAAWTAGGLYALLGAIQIAELGTMIPRSGGQYVFARHALGDYAGFVVGWSDWISTCGTTAAVSIVVGEFTGALVPALRGRAPAVAVIVASAFAIVQWRGIRAGSMVQNVTSLLKAAAFVVLIGAAFAFGGQTPATTDNVVPIPSGLALGTAFVLALQSVIYTYDGWTGVVYFGEEVQEPGKAIPRSLFGGVLSIIVIYLLVNLALLHVLPVSKIAGGRIRGRGRGRRDLRPVRRCRLQNPDDPLDAERHQRLPPDGKPRALRHEPGWAGIAPGSHSERGWDANCGVGAQCRDRHPLHPFRADLREGDHCPGVFLHCQLHVVLYVPLSPPPARTGAATPIPRVGLSLDDGTGTRWVGRISCRRHRRRYSEQRPCAVAALG